MLTDEDASLQQHRVHGSSFGARVINVVGVDSNQGYFLISQIDGSFFGQEWVILEILFCSPVQAPVSIHKHCLAFQRQAFKIFLSNFDPILEISMNDNALKVSKASQLYLA